MASKRKRLEERLCSFDAETRRQTLEILAEMVADYEIKVPLLPKEEVNLHFHTFFSYNANNWSPSRIAWESLKYGLEVSGIVDFDVLDGMDEFLSAGDLLGLKTVVGLETRVFIEEWKDEVTSSPNEPGISYFMAAGCFKQPPAGSEAEAILQRMRDMARERNIALMERVNAYLGDVGLDYEADVIPLTPSGNATERHLLVAYDRKAREVLKDEQRIVAFWAEKLGASTEQIAALMADTPAFHEMMRSKLMKYGGVGYVPPDSGSFPRIEEVIRMIRGIEAIPTATWLDGTNSGEEDARAFLELLVSKGVAALNIIPERNWNIKDPEEKALKVRKLAEIIEVAREFDLPLCVGTEMNKPGLPFVDKFPSPELRPYRKDFLKGARCLYGHTLLASFANFGYFSPQALEFFGDDRRRKNEFYSRVGLIGLNFKVYLLQFPDLDAFLKALRKELRF